jgi:glycosyltransferase involved in cell wall biosynthesis
MISATVIAYNEEKDIARCLKSLSFCDEIIVVDSFSTDQTAEIAKKLGAKVYQKKWEGYGQQKNYAMSLAKNEWVLNLDADEEVTLELKDEILEKISSNPKVNGFMIARKTFYRNKWIQHGGWYPNYVTRLSRKSKSKWTEPSVHETLVVEGMVEKLKNPMNHYTFQDMKDHFQTNVKYAKQGAIALYEKGVKPSILKLLLKPISKFFETYFFKLGFLDGLYGFIISVNAAHSIFMKYSYLYELKEEHEKI